MKENTLLLAAILLAALVACLSGATSSTQGQQRFVFLIIDTR